MSYSVEEMKEKFDKAINKMADRHLREAALKLRQDIPDYFWTAPASSTGKYHPACDLGEGGLARHSYMVMTTALDLLEAEIFVKDITIYKDMAIIATLFHDCMKYGDTNEPGKYTFFNHPLLAAKFVERHIENEYTQHGDEMHPIECGITDAITSAIASHMGKWNTSKYSDAVLPVPSDAFEKLIHTADFIASRKYIDYNSIPEE